MQVLLEALLFSRQLTPQAPQSTNAQAGRWLFRAGTEHSAALLRAGRAAQKPGREPCEKEITWMDPAGREGTSCSGLDKGTICLTHVTGNTLRATPPPTHSVRLIARQPRTREAAAALATGLMRTQWGGDATGQAQLPGMQGAEGSPAPGTSLHPRAQSRNAAGPRRHSQPRLAASSHAPLPK